MTTNADLQTQIARLRMVVAIDSAMLLAILRRMNAKDLSLLSQNFIEACEGLNTQALFSENEDLALQSAQTRKDWWIGLLATLVAEEAGLEERDHQADDGASFKSGGTY